jgi:hypothetical protein
MIIDNQNIFSPPLKFYDFLSLMSNQGLKNNNKKFLYHNWFFRDW